MLLKLLFNQIFPINLRSCDLRFFYGKTHKTASIFLGIMENLQKRESRLLTNTLYANIMYSTQEHPIHFFRR